MYIPLDETDVQTLRTLLAYGVTQPPVLAVPAQKLLTVLDNCEKTAADPLAVRYGAVAKDSFHEDGELEFDDVPTVSFSEEALLAAGIAGAFVMAWQWVDANDLL